MLRRYGIWWNSAHFVTEQQAIYLSETWTTLQSQLVKEQQAIYLSETWTTLQSQLVKEHQTIYLSETWTLQSQLVTQQQAIYLSETLMTQSIMRYSIFKKSNFSLTKLIVKRTLYFITGDAMTRSYLTGCWVDLVSKSEHTATSKWWRISDMLSYPTRV